MGKPKTRSLSPNYEHTNKRNYRILLLHLEHSSVGIIRPPQVQYCLDLSRCNIIRPSQVTVLSPLQVIVLCCSYISHCFWTSAHFVSEPRSINSDDLSSKEQSGHPWLYYPNHVKIAIIIIEHKLLKSFCSGDIFSFLSTIRL